MKNKMIKLSVALAFASASLAAHADYNLTFFNTLGGATSSANSISQSGLVAGGSKTANAIGLATFWGADGTPTALTTLQTVSGVTKINDFSGMVGNNSTSAGKSDLTATYWDTSGTSTLLNHLSTFTNGVTKSSALGINNSGQIVGYSPNASNVSRAVLWTTSGSVTDLGGLGGTGVAQASAINNNGIAVGYSSIQSNNQTHATVWDTKANNISDLGLLTINGISGGPSYAYGVNDLGQVVGGAVSPTSINNFYWKQAALFDNGQVIALDNITNALGAQANTINNKGQIVGTSFLYSTPSPATNRATLWDATTKSATDLNSYLDASLVSSGWLLNNASDINDSGTIVGVASNAALGIGQMGFMLTAVAAVPEADTSAMLLMGAGVMGFMARRRKQAAA